MTPEQALTLLRQTLTVRAGVSLDDMAAILNAWNVIAEMVEKQKQAPTIQPKKE